MEACWLARRAAQGRVCASQREDRTSQRSVHPGRGAKVRPALAMTFQELILTLQHHWAAQGCILAQAYDVEVGAGTMAPTTFLRALGPRAVERGLRAALPAPGRRALRREPEPALPAPPVPGDPQARAQGRAGALPRLAPGHRHRPAGARPPLRGGRLGGAHARRLGARLGGVVRRDGDHPVHLLPAVRRLRVQAGLRRADLRARAHRHVPAERRERLRRGVGEGRELRRGVPPERGGDEHLRLPGLGPGGALRRSSRSTRRSAPGCSRRGCRCRPTIRR